AFFCFSICCGARIGIIARAGRDSPLQVVHEAWRRFSACSFANVVRRAVKGCGGRLPFIKRISSDDRSRSSMKRARSRAAACVVAALIVRERQLVFWKEHKMMVGSL